jgi:hypothetical protein
MSHTFSTLGADHYSLIPLETSREALQKALRESLLGIRSFHRSGLDPKTLGPLIPYSNQALKDLRSIESKVDRFGTIVR